MVCLLLVSTATWVAKHAIMLQASVYHLKKMCPTMSYLEKFVIPSKATVYSILSPVTNFQANTSQRMRREANKTKNNVN